MRVLPDGSHDTWVEVAARGEDEPSLRSEVTHHATAIREGRDLVPAWVDDETLAVTLWVDTGQRMIETIPTTFRLAEMVPTDAVEPAPMPLGEAAVPPIRTTVWSASDGDRPAVVELGPFAGMRRAVPREVQAAWQSLTERDLGLQEWWAAGGLATLVIGVDVLDQPFTTATSKSGRDLYVSVAAWREKVAAGAPEEMAIALLQEGIDAAARRAKLPPFDVARAVAGDA